MPRVAADRPDLKPYVGKKLTVITWLWARTVKSPNPAFAQVDVPLASTFMLSSKPGKEAYVDPVIADSGYRFLPPNNMMHRRDKFFSEPAVCDQNNADHAVLNPSRAPRRAGRLERRRAMEPKPRIVNGWLCRVAALRRNLLAARRDCGG